MAPLNPPLHYWQLIVIPRALASKIILFRALTYLIGKIIMTHSPLSSWYLNWPVSLHYLNE